MVSGSGSCWTGLEERQEVLESKARGSLGLSLNLAPSLTMNRVRDKLLLSTLGPVQSSPEAGSGLKAEETSVRQACEGQLKQF